MVLAYSAFANGGLKVDPVAVLQVSDAQGNVLYQQTPQPGQRVLDPRVAYLITSILSDNKARAPAFGEYSMLRLNRPAAAKTGTTTDWRDNWTIGYTPDLVTGVWVGNADNKPMERVSGITGAGPIWHDFMQEALKGKPIQDFTRPDWFDRSRRVRHIGLAAYALLSLHQARGIHRGHAAHATR